MSGGSGTTHGMRPRVLRDIDRSSNVGTERERVVDSGTPVSGGDPVRHRDRGFCHSTCRYYFYNRFPSFLLFQTGRESRTSPHSCKRRSRGPGGVGASGLLGRAWRAGHRRRVTTGATSPARRERRRTVRPRGPRSAVCRPGRLPGRAIWAATSFHLSPSRHTPVSRWLVRRHGSDRETESLPV